MSEEAAEGEPERKRDFREPYRAAKAESAGEVSMPGMAAGG